MRSFLRSHSGKGTVAVYLAALLLAWPPAVSWLAALALLAFAAQHFYDMFRGLASDADAPPVKGAQSPVATALDPPGDLRPATQPAGLERPAMTLARSGR